MIKKVKSGCPLKVTNYSSEATQFKCDHHFRELLFFLQVEMTCRSEHWRKSNVEMGAETNGVVNTAYM